MRARHFCGLVCVACWPAASPAAFDPADVVQIQASASLYHDNNLFRLPPDLNFGVDPAKRSDTARILGVGLKFDKPVSRQRLIAELNLNETTYDKNSDLDFLGGDGRLAWLWQVGNYWSGEAGYRRRRSLGGFEDEFLKRQDLIDTDIYSFSAGYAFHPRWRIAAELTEEDATHSAQNRRSLDVDGQTAGLSLIYRTPADNSIGLRARRTDRSYPNAATNDNSETRLSAIVVWRLSGGLKLDGQIGHADVKNETRSERDFSGLTWRAAANWDLTGKFRLNVSGFRDIRVYETSLANYVVVNSIGMSPVYAISPKLILQADLRYENREYRPGIPERDDKIRFARVGLTYSPIRYLDFTLSYEAGDRRSSETRSVVNNGVLINDVPINNYEYQSWFGTARVSF